MSTKVDDLRDFIIQWRDPDGTLAPRVDRLIAAVREEEREACAAIAESVRRSQEWMADLSVREVMPRAVTSVEVCDAIAARIRARKAGG